MSARGVEVLGGTYAPDGAHLRRLRAWLLVEHGSLRRLLRRRSVRETFGALEGSSLVGMPRGLPPDADGRPVTAAHPAADLSNLGSEVHN